jgi:predicted MFS family arabinose efflux permease
MIASGIVGRVTIGMAPLAIVLLVRGVGYSYTVAGVAVAAYSLSIAAIAPRLARLIDQIGQTRVLVPIAAAQPAAVVVFAALAGARAAPAALVAAGALIGASEPPLGACVRTLWTAVAPDAGALETAYTLEASLQEVMFTVGPALVALLATTVSPTVALLTAGAVGGAGTLAFAATSLSRSWRPTHAPPRRRGGALGSPGVLTVVLACVAMGAAFGAVEVAAPAFTEAHGSRAAAGIATGAFSLGSLIGGFALGMSSAAGRRHPAVRYITALSLLALTLLLTLTAGSIAGLTVALLIAGLPIAPGFASGYTLVSRLAVPGSATESFAWISTAVTIGAALGTALAGVLVARGSAQTGFGLSAALAGAGAIVLFARRASLGGRGAPAAAGAGDSPGARRRTGAEGT